MKRPATATSLSFLALVLLTVSCADQEDKFSIPLSDLTENRVAGLSSFVACANKDECPSDVALLAMPDINEEEATGSQCSGRMVSDDVLLTNGHCVPEEALPSGSCEGKIWAVFPETADMGPLAVECAEVLYGEFDGNRTFEANESNPDFAFVRLKRAPERGSSDLTLSGVKAGDTVEYFKVDPLPVDNKIRGEIVRKTCELSKDDQVKNDLRAEGDTFALNDLSTLIVEDCESIGGNSGSSVLVDGEIRGVLFGGREGFLFTNDAMMFTNFGAAGLKEEIRELADKFGF